MNNKINASRKIYQRANEALKECERKEDRVILLETWNEFEQQYGDENDLVAVRKLLPKKIKKRRRIVMNDGSDGGWEEYFDYVFPETDVQPHLKFLEKAKLWKQKQQQQLQDENKQNDEENQD